MNGKIDNKNGMLTSAEGHLLKDYYKIKYSFGNCIFYFLKVEKVLFLIQNLSFLFTFSLLTNALRHRLTRP